MRHPLFHWNLPPSEYGFATGVSLGLAFLSLVASRAMLNLALKQGVFSLDRLVCIAAISGALPLYVLMRRYGRRSVGRAVGVSSGGILVALSSFFINDLLGIVCMLSGALLILRHFSAGPAS